MDRRAFTGRADDIYICCKYQTPVFNPSRYCPLIIFQSAAARAVGKKNVLRADPNLIDSLNH